LRSRKLLCSYQEIIIGLTNGC
jgi:hypothetical protein